MGTLHDIERRLKKPIMCGVCGTIAWDGLGPKAFHSVKIEYRPRSLTHMWVVSCWAPVIE